VLPRGHGGQLDPLDNNVDIEVRAGQDTSQHSDRVDDLTIGATAEHSQTGEHLRHEIVELIGHLGDLVRRNEQRICVMGYVIRDPP
jgi:hypothetical protein